MFWPNELSARIINSLGVVSDEGKATVVMGVFCGYGTTMLLAVGFVVWAMERVK